MGMPHWEKSSLLSEIQEGKVVFFFLFQLQVTFIRYSNTRLKSFRTLSLNSEGMLRGTDDFYFILITFSFN